MAHLHEDSSAESIRHRLLKADTDLLIAITRGPVALDIFVQEFTTLHRDFESLLRSTGVGEDLKTLASDTASRIALYAQAFYEVDTEARALDATIDSELESIFADLTISDSSSSRRRPTRSLSQYNFANPALEEPLVNCM